MSNARKPAERLMSIILRIEGVRDQIKALREDEKEIFLESKSSGFDNGVIRQLLRDRAMTDAARVAFEAKLQVYRASLGMLDGTPLGDMARRMFERHQKPSETIVEDDKQMEMPGMPELRKPPAPATAAEIAAAREEGAQAAREGKKVTDNPYGADDLRRAAFDEGWCSEAGSDGMDIPEAWRRKEKPKKKGADNDDQPGNNRDAA
jgi:uncharacterized protein (UPF0335 family)